MLKFLKKVLPTEGYDKLARFLYFKPNDPYNLVQMPPQHSVANVFGISRIKGFRFPAPGSQPAPRIPLRESEDSVYDTNHYVRDWRNLTTGNQLTIPGSHGDVEIHYDNLTIRKQGKRKIGKLDYDPSQTRTTKTANWEALDKALQSRIPRHLPGPFWTAEENAIQEDRAKKGLPPAEGVVSKKFNKRSYVVEYG